MNPFVIQPTYALHSLLRPNRSTEAARQRADEACSQQPEVSCVIPCDQAEQGEPCGG